MINIQFMVDKTTSEHPWGRLSIRYEPTSQPLAATLMQPPKWNKGPARLYRHCPILLSSLSWTWLPQEEWMLCDEQFGARRFNFVSAGTFFECLTISGWRNQMKHSSILLLYNYTPSKSNAWKLPVGLPCGCRWHSHKWSTSTSAKLRVFGIVT